MLVVGLLVRFLVRRRLIWVGMLMLLARFVAVRGVRMRMLVGVLVGMDEIAVAMLMGVSMLVPMHVVCWNGFFVFHRVSFLESRFGAADNQIPASATPPKTRPPMPSIFNRLARLFFAG